MPEEYDYADISIPAKADYITRDMRETRGQACYVTKCLFHNLITIYYKKQLIYRISNLTYDNLLF